MSNRLLVALLQMLPAGADQDANLRKAEDFCRRAAAQGADIALFPEMWSIGYQRFDRNEPGAREAWARQAIREDSPFVRHFAALARELGMAIAPTYLAAADGAPQNALTLIDRRGALKFTYGKVHTCCYETPEAACAPGAGFHVAELDTRAGPVKVGAMICYDREFPESARLLMLQGAELILTPNACSLLEYDRIRLEQSRARAFENMVATAMVNYPAPAHDGHSIACNADGTVVVEAGEEEALVLAAFDLDRLRAWRAAKFWGDAFRRPAIYAPLLSPEASPPVVRTDLFGGPLAARRTS